MSRLSVVLLVLAASAAAISAVFAHGSNAAPAAQIQRTFVSTSGSDANPCTRAEPCRNFAAAITNTLEGGEVIALDSGGYGTFSLSKALTVAGAPGAHVAISVFANNGIVVAAGSGDTVVLRNLYLSGLGGSFGIVYAGGDALHVEGVDVTGFTSDGLLANGTGRLFIDDSRFRNNDAAGVRVDTAITIAIEDTHADRNGTSGFLFQGGATGNVRHSTADRNTLNGFLVTGAGVDVDESRADGNASYGVRLSGTGSVANLTRVTLSHNGSGLGVLTDTSTARIGDSAVTGNATGLLRSLGTLESYGDNLVRGNTTNISGTIAAVSKS